MKKILIVLFIGVLVTTNLNGCMFLMADALLSEEETTKFHSENTDSNTDSNTDKNTNENTNEPTKKEVSSSDIEVLEEYTYSDGFWYTYHFVVIKNNSSKPVSISTSTLAYKSDDSLISTAEGEVNVIGAGATTIYYEAFETEEEIAYYETEMSIDENPYYDCPMADLTYVKTDIEDGAIFQVTNNGTEPIDFVEGYALFTKDGKVVSWESHYFTDDDSEIKPNKTISKQFSAYEKFDTVKFYLTGRID